MLVGLGSKELNLEMSMPMPTSLHKSGSLTKGVRHHSRGCEKGRP